MKVKLIILFYCFLSLEGNSQETKSGGIFYLDYNIFSLEGEGVLDEKQAIKKDKYVKVVVSSGLTIVSVIDTKIKKARKLEFDSSRLLLEGRNFLMHRVPKSGTGSNEKIKLVGKDSLLIFQSLSVGQIVFPSIIYKSRDTIKIERWGAMRDYDTFSLEYLMDNSYRIKYDKFFKEGEKWVYEYFVLRTGYLYRKNLRSRQLRYIDILAWCESKDCQIK